MKLINRYLIKQLTVMSAYALLALLALYSFFDIINEIGDMGKGSYGGMKMMQYVILQIPAHAYELMPLAVLIGGLIALSQLAANSELTVIKTSGMSTRNLLTILLQFGLIFALVTILLGEFAAPGASQYAENMKNTATSGKISTGSQGLWVKERNDIINVGEMLPDRTLRNIKIYRHNDQFRLTESLQAESARIDNDGTWTLHNIQRSLIGSDSVRTATAAEEKWQSGLKSSLLNVLLADPAKMSLSSLTTYINHLKSNSQQIQSYQIEWWRKLMYPVAAAVMALVAFAFTPQSTRNGNMGLKLFGGICLGLAFHFAGRLFGFTSELYGVPPFLAAILPTAIFATWAVYLIRKQEKR
ncbi:MAG: LPS export ABC transporter permease LptG [Neisseria sp.]|uniref:LPS export ABC transporter permease LptG n=1 Tax=Neisseria sp. TaxID=192066 RepID=UPI0026DD8978|nr:LPS export ABC transporter permease LptG [Neisseria sp.]MDO4640525.1 LPS export ABC transporter permease LptG [Neisseria sp.]